MLDIDGAHGEGGGQLVRTAVALAAITGKELRLHGVRAHRAPPGLAPQHLAAIRAVAELCQARTEGIAVGAREFVFRPRRLVGGSFTFDVGTAGSVVLVLQAVLPVASACREQVRMVLRGGTDVRAAPALDYFRHVFLPLLVRIGLRVELEVRRRGYYPRGGGEIVLVVNPATPLALRLEEPGGVEMIGGALHTAGLQPHVLQRMRETAMQSFARFPRVDIEARQLTPDQAVGSGGATVLWARTRNTLIGSSEVVQRGVPAERIVQAAANALNAEILSGATLDIHAADQILVYLGLACEQSHFLTRTLSSHAKTTQWLLQKFLPVSFAASESAMCTRLEVNPAGGAGHT